MLSAIVGIAMMFIVKTLVWSYQVSAAASDYHHFTIVVDGVVYYQVYFSYLSFAQVQIKQERQMPDFSSLLFKYGAESQSCSK